MPEKKFSVKIHELYRKIVAMCDLELLGKKFEDDKLRLEVNERFYKGIIVDESRALKLLKREVLDDSCFNFVGKNTIELAAKAGIINKERVIKVNGVPHAMSLL